MNKSTTTDLKSALEDKLQTLNQTFKTPLEDANSSALLTGSAGPLLFQLYYQKHLNKHDSNLAEKLSELISKELSTPFESTSFCNGLSGFSWFVHHLYQHEFIEIESSIFETLDTLIFNDADSKLKNGNHDFLHGGLGQMLYLADRASKSETAAAYLSQTISSLKKSSAKSDHALFWEEEKQMKSTEEQDKTVVNFHLAHGQASKVAILTRSVEAGQTDERRTLLKTIDFILHNKNTDQEIALLPSRTVNNKKEAYSHLGWCKGNASISIALINAGRVLKNQEIIDEGILIAQKTTQPKSQQNAHLQDAALCHGSSGLSHIYNKLHQLTGLESFKTASTQWMIKTLDQATFEDGLAGFKSWNAYYKDWKNDSSLLTGTAGIGLAMLAHISTKHTAWDRAILLS